MLTEIKKDKNNSRNSIYRCVCGVEKSIRRSAVKSGSTKSCGCHRKKQAVINGRSVLTHGMTNTDVYRYWADHKCKYGLPERWNDFNVFYKDIGKEYKLGTRLLEINGYYKWVSSEESRVVKLKHTSITKYGCEYPQQSEVVKDNTKQSNLKKYGVESVALLERVKQKRKKTCLSKYGVDHYSKTAESKKRVRELHSIYNGSTANEWSERLSISRTTFLKNVRLFGIDYAISYEKNESCIEKKIRAILDDLNIKYIAQFKIENRFADFFIPSKNLVIEADGLYWHSDAINKDRLYHKHKKELYSKYGYTSLFFREDEIIFKSDIIKSILINKLGMSKRFYARKCDIKLVEDKNDIKTFFSLNHLMGSGKGKCYGLYIDNNLVAATQYTNINGIINISRFCSKIETSVVGGFSKLLKCIERENHSQIVNFVDFRYGEGKHLLKLGFTLSNCDVSFKWVKNLDVVSRMRYPGKTGYENGYYRLYDCGQGKYIR